MFGIEIISAGLLPAMFVALAAGIISFLSPCVLPIVPPYLAFMSGVSVPEMQGTRAARRQTGVAALFFVMGLSTIFLLLGFTASVFGAFFLQNQVLFGQIAGAVIIVFGLHFLGGFRIGFLDREARLDAGDRGGSAFGAYILGLAFAFGWTPCIGPQLGAILSLAASEADVARGTTLLGVYALGLGIPFLLAALFIDRGAGRCGVCARAAEPIFLTHMARGKILALLLPKRRCSLGFKRVLRQVLWARGAKM